MPLSTAHLDLNDADDLEIEIATVSGRVGRYRMELLGRIYDWRQHKMALRGLSFTARLAYRRALQDFEDSTIGLWRLLNRERKRLAKLRVRLSARPALMDQLRRSAGLHDEDVAEVTERRRSVAAE